MSWILQEAMLSLSQGDLGGIDNDTLDFSQLDDFINDTNENGIYFQDALVNNELEHTKESLGYGIGSSVQNIRRIGRGDSSPPLSLHLTSDAISHGISSCPITSTSPLVKSASFRVRNGPVPPPFVKPHHLPDSPPDSGSEPPFSPHNEDPKLRCASSGSVEFIRYPIPSVDSPSGKPNGQMPIHQMKHHEVEHVVTSSSPSSTTSPHHHLHHLHHHHHNHLHSPMTSVPIALQSAHSSSLPLLSIASLNSSPGPLLNHLSQNLLSPAMGLQLHHQQTIMTPPGANLEPLYPSEELLYDNLTSPVHTSNKKRKLLDSPKSSVNNLNEVIHVKTEPVVPSPDPGQNSLLPSGDEDYTLDLNGGGGSPFADSNYQCIRFQAFQQTTWVQLLDKDMNEVPTPNFRVDADKGFNFSNADESFVCQKKNHFQVTIHMQQVLSTPRPRFVRTSEGTKPIDKFALHFHGVKMESPTQTIKVEQSQSDRSKKPFKPVPVELIADQVAKTTVGRLHFSETTSNNMRKKGKPNPDQRFFFLVVSLCAHVAGDAEPYLPVVSHASEKIIVRASNPGQFENDMELSWQKGTTQDSIFHAGRVGINTDRPEESLVVHGNIKITGHIVQPSDIRAKVDVHELDTKEQLKNVANLRIVRYRYLPEFAAHVGVPQSVDTGVIAQEVQSIIPEAVMETGDVLLKDGHFVNKLLVVNKERIFMENVGAVKELCKVTDNLENRIDELEKINRKLTSIKRKDSLKSTSTASSRVGSVTSRGKRRSHRSSAKCRFPDSSNTCSNRFVQTTVIALVLVMAFCLIALATLYIMEYQNRHWALPYFTRPTVITVRSSSSPNATSSNQNSRTSPSPETSAISLSETILPFTSTLKTSNDKIGTSQYYSTNPPTQRRQFTIRPSSVSTSSVEKTSKVFGEYSVECRNVGNCPVFCCSQMTERQLEREMDAPEQHGLTHVDTKRSEYTVENKFTGKKLDPSTFPLPSSIFDKTGNNSVLMHDGETIATEETQSTLVVGSSASEETNVSSRNLTKRNKETGSSERRSHNTIIQEVRKFQKRMVIGNEAPKTDTEKDNSLSPSLQLLELNTSLNRDFCNSEHSTESPRVTCKIFLSRHFPLANLTLRLSTETTTFGELCGGTDFVSCPSEHGIGEKDVPNFSERRDFTSQGNLWILPVGSYFASTYRFRVIPRNQLLEGQQLCSMQGHQSMTEYILIFQRRCDI